MYALIIGRMMGELKVSLTLVIPFAVIRKYSGCFHAKRELTAGGELTQRYLDAMNVDPDVQGVSGKKIILTRFFWEMKCF